MNKTSARLLAGLIIPCAAVLATAAPASAATPNITGDAGAPVPLTAGLTLRQMAPDVTFTFTGEETHYSARVVGPTGPASSGSDCFRTSSPSDERIGYQGNGTYTLFYKTAGSLDACRAATESSVAFTINASTGLGAPPAKFLYRPKGSFVANPLELPVNANPGAEVYEVRFAANAKLGPDGGIAGTAQSGFVDMSTGKARMTFSSPGRYTVVIRAKSFRTDVPTPWGPPVVVRVLAPFEILTASLPDSRGPSYKATVTLREKSARGKVRITIGKGTRPKRFRRLGTAKIRKGGKFSFRFNQRGYGKYTLRFTYKGGSTVAAGTDFGVLTLFRI